MTTCISRSQEDFGPAAAFLVAAEQREREREMQEKERGGGWGAREEVSITSVPPGCGHAQYTSPCSPKIQPLNLNRTQMR